MRVSNPILLSTALLFGCSAPATVNRVYSAGTCPNGGECLNRLAARQCPNGANDYSAYRDRGGRLHVDAGCD